MKKFFAIVLLLAVLLSCCACGAKEDTQQTQPEKIGEPTAEDMYGHIDQTVLVDGYYKIWSDVGIKNMANHPDAKFELLCNVDMGGQTLAPIENFTGTIKGGNFTVSNFILQGGDEEDFGFVTVNRGKIQNFLLDAVTFVPGKNAKNIGSLAGVNENEILRCTVGGTLVVESAAADASCGGLTGVNTGALSNSIANVDVSCTAANVARVGGIAGTITGGTVEFVTTGGRLDVTGGQKAVGLFAGHTENVVLTGCAFLGASNTVDGKLFTNFTGDQDDERKTVMNGLWRDNQKEPLTENQKKLRETVVQAMYDMGSVEWTTPRDLRHSCSCTLTICSGTYVGGRTHYGIPYNHKAGSLDRFLYAMDENHVAQEWVYDMAEFDGYDAYIGNDCSTAVLHAWYKVTNSCDFMRCTYQLPQYERGCLPVGEYNCDFALDGKYTYQYLEHNDEQTIYEAYGKLRKGDAYVYIIDKGGHTRMAAEDAVVVRDQDGKINPDHSYVISHEQGSTTYTEEYITTWKLNYKYTFANLYFDSCIPVTCEELVTGEMEPLECSLEGGAEGKAGLVTGTVKANYFLDSVSMRIIDDNGAEVMDHRIFTTAGRWDDHGHNDFVIRTYNETYDMAGFATVLQDYPLEPGKTYAVTVTAHLGTGDDVVVREFSFTNGTA